MTYLQLKNTVKGLLVGDLMLPKEDEVVVALLGMAYNHIGMHAQALHLLTLDKDSEILRIGVDEYMTRKPDLPNTDDSMLDIDDELGYVAARLIASYVSKEKAGMHYAAATEMIRDYNGKVYEILDSIKYNEEKGRHEL